MCSQKTYLGVYTAIDLMAVKVPGNMRNYKQTSTFSCFHTSIFSIYRIYIYITPHYITMAKSLLLATKSLLRNHQPNTSFSILSKHYLLHYGKLINLICRPRKLYPGFNFLEPAQAQSCEYSMALIGKTPEQFIPRPLRSGHETIPPAWNQSTDLVSIPM